MKNKLIIATLLGVLAGAFVYAIARSDKNKVRKRRIKY